MRSHSASLTSTTLPTSAMPTLLSTTSMRPYAFRHAATIASTSAALDTSDVCAMALPPSLVMIPTVSSAAAGFRSTQKTCAPSRAKVTAVALPLPQPGPIDPAPTTIATLPLSRSIDILPFRFCCCAAGLTVLELPQSFAARKQAFGVGIGGNLDQRTVDLDA